MAREDVLEIYGSEWLCMVLGMIMVWLHVGCHGMSCVVLHVVV